MRAFGLPTALQNFGRASVGDVRAFQRLVVLPQIFVFVAYISVGAALREPPAASVLKLATVAYLLLVNMIVQGSLRRFSARLLSFHVACLAVLLSLSCLIMGQLSLINVYAPMSIVILALVLVPLTWHAAMTVCVTSGVVLTLFWAVELILRNEWWYQNTRGPLLICGSYFVLLLRTLIRSLHGFPGSFSLPPGAFSVKPARAAPQDKPHGSAELQRYEDGTLLFVDELRGEFGRRLLIISGAYVLVTLALTLEALRDRFEFVFVGLLLLLAQGWFLRRNQSLRNPQELYFNGLILFALGIAWWCILLTLRGPRDASVGLALALLVLAYGALPWRPSLALSVPAIAAIISLLLARAGAAPALIVVIIAMGAVSCAGAVLAHHALVVRSIILHLRRLIELGVSTTPLLHQVSRRLTELFDCDRALLISGSGTEVITAEDVLPSGADSVFAHGLADRISELPADEGALMTRELGEQFLPALADWFETPPRQLIYLRAHAIIDGNETTVLLILPVRARLRIVGIERNFRSALCVFALVRGALSATRSRFLSSDVLLETQQIVAEREQELSQVVHLVNNIAQDLAIQCEALGPAVNGSADSHKRVQLIESLARNLSAGVSDIKLQREFLRSAIGDRSEEIDIEVLLDELRLYGKYREHRRGDSLEIIKDIPGGSVVRVVSREFLETGLRSLLRCSTARMEQGGRIQLRAAVKDKEFILVIQDNGQIISNELSSTGGDGSDSQRERQYYDALENLARRSGGSLRRTTPGDGYSNAVELRLPAASAAGKLRVEQGHWALLVDDNAQVTTFYARVAEALNLKYVSAASVEEAEQKIDEHGRPRIVVTDIQLGEGSGLHLVRTVRRLFGESLPVIVVSGHTAEALAEEVQAAGATKYLVKPVGRAKLFSEIRALLSSPN